MEGKPKKNRTRSKRERFAAFAENYLNAADSTTFLNVCQSALAAGYSKTYALASSYKLLEKTGIQREIDRIKTEKRGNPNIATADEVLEALTTQIRVLPNELFDKDTKQPISPADMDRRLAQAIAGYKVKRHVIPGESGGDRPSLEITYEFKLVDRQKAAEMLGRWHGIWEKDNKQKAPTAPQALVAFPTGTMSLEAWQEAAIAILDAKEKPKASCP